MTVDMIFFKFVMTVDMIFFKFDIGVVMMLYVGYSHALVLASALSTVEA